MSSKILINFLIRRSSYSSPIEKLFRWPGFCETPCINSSIDTFHWQSDFLLFISPLQEQLLKYTMQRVHFSYARDQLIKTPNYICNLATNERKVSWQLELFKSPRREGISKSCKFRAKQFPNFQYLRDLTKYARACVRRLDTEHYVAKSSATSLLFQT